jgi:hypothetical protein
MEEISTLDKQLEINISNTRGKKASEILMSEYFDGYSDARVKNFEVLCQ